MADKLIVEVILEPATKSGSFKKVEDKATKAGKKSGDGFSKGFTATVGAGLAGVAKNVFGIALAFKAVSSALAGLSASFDNLRGFSRAISEINSILPITAKLTAETTQKLIDFSRSFGTDQQSQAKAFYNIVSAGVKGLDNQLQTLSVSNKAAVAGLVDIDTAATLLVSSVNAYSKAGLTATKASDILFVAVREGQTTFSELAGALGNVTSIAANSGVEFEELAGALAFVTKSGIKTDVAATGLRQVFASIIKPSKEAADEAKRVGLEFSKAAVETKGLAGFLKSVQVATKGNEQSLAKLFGNIRALAPILNVVNGNFEDFERILKETKKSSGATSDAFDEIASSLDFKFDQVSAEFSAFGLNLLRIVNPALMATAGVLKNVGKALNSIFGVESQKPLEVTRKRINGITKSVSMWMDKLAQAKKMPQKTLFGGESASGKAVRNIQTRIDILKTERVALREQMFKLIKDKEVYEESLKPKPIEEPEAAAPSVDNFQNIRDVFGGVMGGMTADIFEATTTMEQRLAQSNKVISSFAKKSGMALRKGIGMAAGSAFAEFGKALQKGENSLEAFGKMFLKAIGDVMVQQGTAFILEGAAYAFSANPVLQAKSSGLIASGAAMAAFGGFLGASVSPQGGASGGGGGGASGGAISDTITADESEVEERNTQGIVNITVEGSLVQQEELGSFISDVISESNQKNGNVILNPRFA
jgi:TP901 family phage tail tape measure protein